MTFFKANMIKAALLSAASLMSIHLYAAEDQRLQKAFASTDIKAAIVGICKEDTTKTNKFTAAEVDKYCKCRVDSDSKITDEQKWAFRSAVNAKKDPTQLPFVKQQNASLEACLGAPLTQKVMKIMKDAAQAQQAAKK